MAFHWVDFVANATVLLDWRAIIDGKMDWKAALRAIPKKEVEAMRATIAKNAHGMQYSAVDAASLRSGGGLAVRDDAFDEALSGAWRNARDAERSGAVAAGRWRQRMHRRGAGVGYCEYTAPGAGVYRRFLGRLGVWRVQRGAHARRLPPSLPHLREMQVRQPLDAREGMWMVRDVRFGEPQAPRQRRGWLTVAADAELPLSTIPDR